MTSGLLRPGDDLWSEPQQRSPPSEIQDRTRHVRIQFLIRADRVPTSKPKYVSYALSVNEVLCVDSRGHSPEANHLRPALPHV